MSVMTPGSNIGHNTNSPDLSQFSTLPPGKYLNQAMTTSCHILSKLSFISHHINNTTVLRYWQISETNTQ